MATHSSDCTREGCHYASSGSASGWTSSSKFYSGKDGTWYRSRVTFKTGSFSGVSQSGKRFVMKLTIDSTASPCGCMATLTTKSLTPGKIMNDSVNGPHADLTAGCIGQSYAWENSAATTASTGTNKSSGYTFYFSFSSSSIQPNTTYYVYCHYKSGRGSSTGWTRCNASALSAWVEYTPNWTLTTTAGTGVASFTGDGDYAHGTDASATCTTNPGYQLTKYTGTQWEGAAGGEWTDCAGLTSHNSAWTMRASRTITANAAVSNFTYTFNANGGSVSPTTKSVTFGTTATGLPTPTRTGYDFQGWYLDLFGQQHFNLGRNMMYTDKFSVHLEAYSDNWADVASTRLISCTEGGGWNIESVSNCVAAIAYDSGVGYKYATTGVTWTSLGSGWHSFDIIFNGSNLYCYIDETLQATSPAFSSGKISYNGNNFICLGAEAGNSIVTPAGAYFVGKLRNVIINHNTTRVTHANAKNSFTVPAENLTLKADWSLKTFPITYNANGGSPTPASQTKTYGTTLTLRGAIEHDPGIKTVTTTFDGNGGTVVGGSTAVSSTAIQEYSFAGWKATDGTVYSAGGSYTKNESTTMTAQWSTSPYVGEEAISLPDASRVGYTFKGWYNAPTGGTQVTTYYPNSDTTLYAQWQINYNDFSIYDYQDILSSTLVAYGSEVVLPAINMEEVSEPWDAYCIYFHHNSPDGPILMHEAYQDVYRTMAPSGSYSIEYYDEAAGWVMDTYYPGDIFVMPDAYVYAWINYDSTGFVSIFKAPTWSKTNDPTVDENGNTLAYKAFNGWVTTDTDLLPATVPAGARIEHRTTPEEGYSCDAITYYSTFVPDIKVIAYYNDAGTMKVVSNKLKHMDSYVNVNAFWIKSDNKWMTLQEYEDSQE